VTFRILSMYRVFLEKLIVGQLVKTFSMSDRVVTQLVLIPWALYPILVFFKKRKNQNLS
jgi:hypothetical protein